MAVHPFQRNLMIGILTLLAALLGVGGVVALNSEGAAAGIAPLIAGVACGVGAFLYARKRSS